MSSPAGSIGRAGARGWAVVVALAAVQLVVLVWAVHKAIWVERYCSVCDTAYYLAAADAFARDGLLFANPFDGYRSYFVPMVVSAVASIARHVGVGGDTIAQSAVGLAGLYFLASTLVIAWATRRYGVRATLLAAPATLVNPFLVVYVPHALQESVLLALGLPILFAWFVARDAGPARLAVLVVVLTVLAYTIRAAMLWWVLAGLAYVAWKLRELKARERGLTMLVAGAVALALIGPQIYIAQKHFGALNPYPVSGILSQQTGWGIDLLKYTTVLDEGHWRGLTVFSPYVSDPQGEKTLASWATHPMRSATLVLTHAYVGLHYDQILPFWRLDRASATTWPLAFSSAIVFFGVLGFVARAMTRRIDAEWAFLLATVVLCLLSFCLFAVEPRFGLPAFAALSLAAVDWLATAHRRAVWAAAAAGFAAYLAAASMTDAFLLRAADIAPDEPRMHPADASAIELAPLRWLRNEAIHDSIYTIDPDRVIAGYRDMGPIALVEARGSPYNRPLACLYAAEPRTNTFCSTSQTEQKIVRSMGYVDTGTAGFVRPSRADGLVPLFRLSRGWGDDLLDREHRFVTTDDEVRALRTDGWSYDGAKGFVKPLDAVGR